MGTTRECRRYAMRATSERRSPKGDFLQYAAYPLNPLAREVWSSSNSAEALQEGIRWEGERAKKGYMYQVQ